MLQVVAVIGVTRSCKTDKDRARGARQLQGCRLQKLGRLKMELQGMHEGLVINFSKNPLQSSNRMKNQATKVLKNMMLKNMPIVLWAAGH
ncbi:hypothetical protein GOP47_0015436 [Adiantum capillus-veneris]|uniref:Uncharacterized protein n=1 Tax=Adiantum capillus-veneris TaxID=13818 RepID=A0A9D4UJR7_ADICA|nr:hypothetical protein GOP47_0015436 [Adiantum capillus-veneris]